MLLVAAGVAIGCFSQEEYPLLGTGDADISPSWLLLDVTLQSLIVCTFALISRYTYYIKVNVNHFVTDIQMAVGVVYFVCWLLTRDFSRPFTSEEYRQMAYNSVGAFILNMEGNLMSLAFKYGKASVAKALMMAACIVQMLLELTLLGLFINIGQCFAIVTITLSTLVLIKQ